MITATPKINISAAKIQKKNAGISVSLSLVPFENDTVHHAADLQKLVFVVYHVFPREPGNGVVLPQKNGLLGADLLAHPAVDAANHVDVEGIRKFFNLGESISGRNFAWNN